MKGIARRLEDRNWRVRKAAAGALGDISTAEVWGRTPGKVAASAVPELIKRLSDTDPGVRRNARAPLDALRDTTSIGDIRQAAAPAVPELEQRLRDEDWMVREQASKTVAGLGAIAAPCIPALLECIADDSHQVRKAAKASLEALISNDDVEDLRAFGAPASLKLQTQLLENEDWRVRCAAAWALGTAGGAAALGARRLEEALEDNGDPQLHFLALEALGNLGLGATPALPSIVKKIFDDEETIKEAARGVHARFLALRGKGYGSEAPEVARLLRKLADQDPWHRKHGVQGLCELGLAAGPALPQLFAAVLDDDFDTSVAATEAVERLHELQVLGSFDWHGPEGSDDVDIGKALLAALEDEHWAVTLHAAEALAKLAAAAAPMVLKLTDRFEAEDSPYRFPARSLLKSLRKEGAGNMLELGEVLDAIIPHLVEKLAELEGPICEMALGALETLYVAGLLEDPNGYLEEAAEVIRMDDT